MAVYEGADLRFGDIAGIVVELTGEKMPKQLDLLDRWFPGLIIAYGKPDGDQKKASVYSDPDCMITAVRYKDSLYLGDNERVTQICGRLIGMAKGNQEKERKASELIRKQVARKMVDDMEVALGLQKNTADLLGKYSEEQLSELHEDLSDLVWSLAEKRTEMSEYERDCEPFPMDDETFDGIVLNASYQLVRRNYEGLVNAYLWLLTGGLLRNESGRVLRMFDSGWIAVNRHPSETPALLDRLDYMWNPEDYEYTYSGDDTDEKFPGIEWYCDNRECEDHLNEQEGFDQNLPVWQCRKCGTLNRLSMDEVYDSREAALNGMEHSDIDKMNEAIQRRKKEKKK